MKTDYKTIKVEMREGVALFVMDNPPVNQLSEHFVRELAGAIAEAFRDAAVQAIVLTGAGKNFIAGADITQIKDIRTREQILELLKDNNRFLNSIETGPKPVIAAINGNCLGGGLELAMACHYRVAARGVDLGQAEVQIGLIPGAGGTQRLPRLIGLPNALDMITTGKSVKSEKAFERTLVDELADPAQLVETAVKAARRFMSGQLNLKLRSTRFRYERLPSAAEKKALLGFATLMTAAKAKGYIAPLKAIEAFEKGLGYDIDADLDREAELFADCLLSDVAQNLIGIFLNTRAAGRVPRIEGLKPAAITKVAMLGGGVMGSGIVHLLLTSGFQAVLWDIHAGALEKGIAALRGTFDYHIKNKKMSAEELEGMLKDRLVCTSTLDDLKEVDLVIEAVLEDMQVKQDIWKKLEGICRPDVFFATNTSALPITEMASVLEMSMKELSQSSLLSNNTLKINSTCTIFAESEVISLVNEGHYKNDIARAVCDAIASKAASLVQELNITEEVVFIGGIARNASVSKLLKEKIGREIIVPEEPRIVAAIGAAVAAR